jgi:hypothetical protein
MIGHRGPFLSENFELSEPPSRHRLFSFHCLAKGFRSFLHFQYITVFHPLRGLFAPIREEAVREEVASEKVVSEEAVRKDTVSEEAFSEKVVSKRTD